jgi:transposase
MQGGKVKVSRNAQLMAKVGGGHIIWLFAGSDQGGHRAAAMYTMLNTAKLNGINPEKYLHYVLARINDHKINRIGELLPWNVDLEKDDAVATETQEQAASDKLLESMRLVPDAYVLNDVGIFKKPSNI